MQFRPCIDIHDGRVKQIVGGSLGHEDRAKENFISEQDAAFFADLYREKHLKGGHVILLNGREHPLYEKTKEQALKALRAYPMGLQAGGGITDQNAEEFMEAGASHVIVTSFVFRDGKIDYDRLERLVKMVGREHVVLDLSCRKRDGKYYIVTDRWQKYTDTVLDLELLKKLEGSCDEYLIHAVDVEGKASGIEEEVVKLLGSYENRPVTYAGGVHNYQDLEDLKRIGNEHVNVTIGSALDLFGGSMSLDKVMEICAYERA
ncbi:MAG: phosphoribosylformimino-5-aminoimidazole carboxamide ribotide isomerase [Lachnospiraceae bacterium]|nr:phosphoribosylformimino-5-aminoimidazole carboxamide ribotide isomerase [Lachnospiraceae bacterium]